MLASVSLEFLSHLGEGWEAIWATIAAQDASRTTLKLTKRRPGGALEPGDAQELPKRRPGTLQTSIFDKICDVFGHFLWIFEGF